MNKRKLGILPFILAGLIIGLLSGLIRMGWQIYIPNIAPEHGAIMIGSFLGTLICLERAVVIKKKLIYIIPFLSGSSIIPLILDFDQTGYILLILASAGLIGMFIHFYQKTNEMYDIIMMIGAAMWMIGNIIVLLTGLFPMASSWWVGFLFFTIVGERLELTKFLPLNRFKKSLLLLSLMVFAAGLIIPFHGIGKYLLAAGMIFAALWLLKYDMAKKAVKKEGLTKYSGAALIMGYIWLLISGILFTFGPAFGFLYDAALHTFFIGFVFSMIFAHGPIILPGVMGVPFKPYHPVLHVWLILLQLTLILRTFADVEKYFVLRKWSGMANGIVIIAFFITLAVLVKKFSRKNDNSKRKAAAGESKFIHV